MQTIESAERVALELRTLYHLYGYTPYKMSKFEEYDLYAQNKDFLISDNVITFNDLSGKLMALKPDVTLSIVKNSKEDPTSLQKVYYNENVYRVTKGSQCFKEIMQVGLECLGNIDDYCITEVLTLAAKSLAAISENAVLEISHVGMLSQLLDSIGIPRDIKQTVIKLISEKNAHELTKVCREAGVPEMNIDLLRQLIITVGPPKKMLYCIMSLMDGLVDQEAMDQFVRVLRALQDSEIGSMLRIDFSAVNDIHYYNGFVFKGYVQGLPGSVLSGGQYDRLMRKMKRTDRAMGFAVYTDMLDRLEQPTEQYDVDTVLLYDDSTPLKNIREHAESLMKNGCSVLVQRTLPKGLRRRQVLILTENEVLTFEKNA